MTPTFQAFSARLRDFISRAEPGQEGTFNSLALELFALQFAANASYHRFCAARHLSPANVEHWTRIPALPTAAFKDREITCLAPAERTQVFHSSGTTQHRPGRHFHNRESLAIYEASLLPWFQAWVGLEASGTGVSPVSFGSHGRDARATTVQPDRFSAIVGDEFPANSPGFSNSRFLCLTPPPERVPHSSLAYMFGAIQRALPSGTVVFVGRIAADGAWALDEAAAERMVREAETAQTPLAVLGTAFSFVNWFDELAAKGVRHALPAGSRVMETGGYKGRSRSLPRAELHAMIAERLGVPAAGIVCEYGMSELSSQAYASAGAEPERRVFHFPPWARAQVISPETGTLVGEGETGLMRVLDLANVFSLAAIQTEDLAVRRGDGFELLGRAAQAEPRGCSLLAVA